MDRPSDEEVVQVLAVVRTCQSMKVLPRAGGLLDQDAYFVLLLQLVLAADSERAALDKARQKAA